MRNKRNIQETLGSKTISKVAQVSQNENVINMFTSYLFSNPPSNTAGSVLLHNPFIETDKMDTTDSTYTVFQLGENEILHELLQHLQSDCPDIMHDRSKLLERVAQVYDNMPLSTYTVD